LYNSAPATFGRGTVLTAVCLFVSDITQEVIGGFYCEILGIGRCGTEKS